MKRMDHLYENIYKPENIMQAFDEVCRNMKNKKKVNAYKDFSRENLGTRAGLEFHYKYMNLCKIKYGTFYILKFDVSKFFASIDHDILKIKIKRYIKDI